MKEMGMSTLKDGIYRVSKTVKNPAADRRKTRDWTAEPEFPEGLRVYLTTAGDPPMTRVEVLGQYGVFYSHSAPFKALEPVLVPVEPTVREQLQMLGVWPMDALVKLVERRAISVAQVAEVQKLLEGEADEEHEKAKQEARKL